jgi:uncharacterized membrane protein (DUF106 family)
MFNEELNEDFLNNELNNSVLLEKEKNIYINIIYTYDTSDNSFKLENQNENELKELNNEQNNYIKTQINIINNSLKRITSNIPIFFLLFRFLIYLFCMILFLIFCHMSILFCALCLLNPAILIMIIALIITNGISIVKFIYTQFKEKIKLKKLKIILEFQNKFEAKNLKMVWSYGRDGTWIEVMVVNKLKNIIDSNNKM